MMICFSLLDLWHCFLDLWHSLVDLWHQWQSHSTQPPRYIQNFLSLVFHFQKSLYGLMKAPWAWYSKMDSFLLHTSFSKWHSNPNFYTKKVGDHLILHVLYFDELILIGSDPKLLTHVKSIRRNKFEMANLGHLHYFLSLQVFNLKKEFPFPSLNMDITFFTTFKWNIVN